MALHLVPKEIMKEDILEITKYYFNVFSQKKIDELSKLFSEDVKLRDWQNQASGKKEVLKINQKIFDSVNSIKVIPLKLDKVEKKIYAELEIIINDKEKRLVLDVISFNDDNKINNIEAYQG